MSKATTFRIDPQIQGGLKTLAKMLGRPVNKLVNDALLQFVRTEAGRLEVDLQQDIDLLRRYRELDPDLSRSVELAGDREMAYAGNDPLEGKLLPEETTPPGGAPRLQTVGVPWAPTAAQQDVRKILKRR